MKSRKIVPIIIIGIIILAIFLGLFAAIQTGHLSTDFGATFTEEGKEPTVQTIDSLDDGSFYIWHDDKVNDIKKDIENPEVSCKYQLLPSGTVNWTDGDDYDPSATTNAVWFSSSNDKDIPTLYPGDELIYISSTDVPYEGLSIQRFADYGYTIGVSNMTADVTGHHYYISRSDDDAFTIYLNPDSDAADLKQFDNSQLFLDKVGGVPVEAENLSKGGTVNGLTKDKTYTCEWYTGTFYQDFNMCANVHAFGGLENFTIYDFSFLHSNCISIPMPDYLKSGYYYVNNTGIFRFVNKTDAAKYNGSPYDASINWNDPIILYDDNGYVTYDPTNPDFKGNEADSGTNDDGSLPAGQNREENIINEEDAQKKDEELLNSVEEKTFKENNKTPEKKDSEESIRQAMNRAKKGENNADNSTENNENGGTQNGQGN